MLPDIFKHAWELSCENCPVFLPDCIHPLSPSLSLSPLVLSRDVADILKFKVTRSNASSFSPETQIYFGLPSRTGTSESDYAFSVSDAALTPGTIYYYRIQAQTLACPPAQFPTVTCGGYGTTNVTAVGRPGPVSNAAGVLNNAKSVTISWGLPADTGQGNASPNTVVAITGFFMAIKFCPNPPCTADTPAGIDFTTSDGALATKTFDGLTEARDYQWDIQAINIAG